MYKPGQIVLLLLLGAVFALRSLASRFPQVSWLQMFRLPQLSEAQRAKQRRRGNVMAGLELILLGIIVPLGYGALTLMTFSDFTTAGVLFVAAGSIACIGFGVTAFWQNRSSS